MLESMGDEIYIYRRTKKLHFCLFLFLFVCFLTFLTVFHIKNSRYVCLLFSGKLRGQLENLLGLYCLRHDFFGGREIADCLKPHFWRWILLSPPFLMIFFFFWENLMREMSLLNPAPWNNGSEILQFLGTSNKLPQTEHYIPILSEVTWKKRGKSTIENIFFFSS